MKVYLGPSMSNLFRETEDFKNLGKVRGKKELNDRGIRIKMTVTCLSERIHKEGGLKH